MRDLAMDITVRVSEGLYGDEANFDSKYADIAPDGSQVGFTSVARNLVDGDVNAKQDTFVAELKPGLGLAATSALEGTWSVSSFGDRQPWYTNDPGYSRIEFAIAGGGQVFGGSWQAESQAGTDPQSNARIKVPTVIQSLLLDD